MRSFLSPARPIAFVWLAASVVLGYIDPNTGGLLFQLLAAFLTVLSALILFFPRQIRRGAARIKRFVQETLSRSP